MVRSRPIEPETELLDLHGTEEQEPQRFAVSRNGMVATQHYVATRVGAEILREGGNAVDAAVAAALALGVCEPAASGLGGQTHLMVHLAGREIPIALDGSSRAPNRATPESLSARERMLGYKAATVPSTPAVMEYAVRRYGVLDWPRVLAPAIAIAEEGYPVSSLQRGLARREQKNLKAGNAAPIFLKGGKRPYPVGERFRQPALAATLRRLSEAGVEDFYTGEIADTILADMERNGGLIRKDDLVRIPWPIERKPVRCRFRGMRVFSFPPPGAGRTLVEMLNILSRIPKPLRDIDSPEGVLALVEVIRQANIDRRDRPFDPNYYHQVEEKRMLSRKYAKSVAEGIHKKIETGGDTTHLSAMDRDGNVVSLTQSIERVFGAKVVTPELGFLYNNWMSAFEYEDMSHPYYLRPNAVPWSSAAPTIVLRENDPWLSIGSPGSERITSAIVQVLLRLVNQNPYDAVAAPRVHCSLAGKVSLEASRMRDDIPDLLEEQGFTVDRREPYAFYLGCVQLVLHNGRSMMGVADPRRDGSAEGAHR